VVINSFRMLDHSQGDYQRKGILPSNIESSTPERRVKTIFIFYDDSIFNATMISPYMRHRHRNHGAGAPLSFRTII
jgi:hypothetical protein